jgi:hypothetical protein
LNSLSVNILLQKLAITVTVGSLLFSSPTVAQVRKLLPFVDYLVDVGPNEFRKSHPSFPSECASRWDFLLDLDFNVTLTASDTALWMV